MKLKELMVIMDAPIYLEIRDIYDNDHCYIPISGEELAEDLSWRHEIDFYSEYSKWMEDTISSIEVDTYFTTKWGTKGISYTHVIIEKGLEYV